MDDNRTTNRPASVNGTPHHTALTAAAAALWLWLRLGERRLLLAHQRGAAALAAPGGAVALVAPSGAAALVAPSGAAALAAASRRRRGGRIVIGG